MFSQFRPYHTNFCIEKALHTDYCLDWNSNLPISAKKAFNHALVYRAEYVCSILEILAKEMDYLCRVVLKNHYLDWMIKKLKRNQ